MADVQRTSPRQAMETTSVSFITIFALSFLLFSAIAVVGQLLGAQWRTWLPGAEGVKSLTGGVKAAVYTFMSHLQ
jgi:light-harvesting complex 1 beta chain